MKRGEQFAFPRPPGYDAQGELVAYEQEGLTIREHFAAVALQAILTNPKPYGLVSEAGVYSEKYERAADIAVRHAEAMMERLGRTA